MFTALDFFAGSGLVDLGLAPEFETVWANDICPKKRAVYIANHPSNRFHLIDIKDVRATSLPPADLAWASFPCQDLSLAGNGKGMHSGTRSGLFWEWVRILNELKRENKLPSVLVAENVVGFLTAANGKHFALAYRALSDLGFKVGALVIDAKAFVPQSRPRAFIVAVRENVSTISLTQEMPTEPFHPRSLKRAAAVVDDPNWLWWSLPLPQGRTPLLSELCEREATCDLPAKTRELCSLLSPFNQRKLDAALGARTDLVGTGYRRTRPDEHGRKKQQLEIRFDGVAGCLRTPNCGSSRQTMMIVDRGELKSRLMTVRECARLMGAPDTYVIEGGYNDGYRAMGDAVAVPVTRWLSRHLLAPLAGRSAHDLVARGSGMSGNAHQRKVKRTAVDSTSKKIGVDIPKQVEVLPPKGPIVLERVSRVLDHGSFQTWLSLAGGALAGLFSDARYLSCSALWINFVLVRSRALEGMNSWQKWLTHGVALILAFVALFLMEIKLNQSRPHTYTPADYANAVSQGRPLPIAQQVTNIYKEYTSRSNATPGKGASINPATTKVDPPHGPIYRPDASYPFSEFSDSALLVRGKEIASIMKNAVNTVQQIQPAAGEDFHTSGHLPEASRFMDMVRPLMPELKNYFKEANDRLPLGVHTYAEYEGDLIDRIPWTDAKPPIGQVIQVERDLEGVNEAFSANVVRKPK